MSFLIPILFFSCKKETAAPVVNNPVANSGSGPKIDCLDSNDVYLDSSYFVKYEYDGTLIHVINHPDNEFYLEIFNDGTGTLFGDNSVEFLSSELVNNDGDDFYLDFWLDSANALKLGLENSLVEKKKILTQLLKPGEYVISEPDRKSDAGSCWFAVWDRRHTPDVTSISNTFNSININGIEEVFICSEKAFYAVEGNFQCKMTGGTIKNGEFKLLFSTP